ncbi:phage tail protein [Providencia sp. Je.9.19]|uniref:phage tail protein n=1 Tax=Providencia sp. Je.9.19 TaxID=3142844 RepID=UPI003DA904C0
MINPKLIVVPFAADGQKDEIPVTRDPTMPTQKATWDLGFPPATMLPESAGGLPPRGLDFNGIFNQISEMLVHFAKGGRIKFSESYAEEIGGYQKGAILQSDDETKDYQSLIDGNKVNFNTASSAQINDSWKLISTTSLATDISSKLDKKAVLQTTGNSKTGVMSQDAVTSSLPKQATTSINGTVTLVSSTGQSTSKVMTQKAVTDAIVSYSVPVGSPIPWPQSSPPEGYFSCNGQEFNKTAYPLLAKAYPSGKLPDLRGEFIRGLDAGRGVDPGRLVASPQLDEFKRHQHLNGAKVGYDGATGSNTRVVSDGGAGTWLTSEVGGTETRPRNIAFLYIVKAA